MLLTQFIDNNLTAEDLIDIIIESEKENDKNEELTHVGKKVETVKATKEQLDEVLKLIDELDFSSVMSDLNGGGREKYPLLDNLEMIEVATIWIAPEKVELI